MTDEKFWRDAERAALGAEHVTLRSPPAADSLTASGSLEQLLAEAATMSSEVLAQIERGHPQFCVGVHPATDEYPAQEEWVQWDVAAKMLAEKLQSLAALQSLQADAAQKAMNREQPEGDGDRVSVPLGLFDGLCIRAARWSAIRKESRVVDTSSSECVCSDLRVTSVFSAIRTPDEYADALIRQQSPSNVHPVAAK